MSVIDGGITYGCSDDLEDRAYGIAFAARDLERVLRRGGSLPKEYTIAGEVYRVVRITGVVADGKTNNQTALAAAVSASRSGNPTILVLPPASGYYRYSNLLPLSENTYIVGYGARVKPVSLTNTAWQMNNNTGIFGLKMDGVDGSYSRWLERLLTNVDSEPAKDGTVSNGAGGGVNNDAWINMWDKTNCILMDVQTRGSIAGMLRCTSNNVLVENCSAFRTHSDSFHIFKQSQYVTARRCKAVESGDDCFSFIQYSDSPGSAQPKNILVEECEASGSRARGMTTVSGRDILFLRCLASETCLAPFMAAVTSAHSLTNCNDIKFVECEAWRGAKRTGGGAANGAGFSFWTSGSFQVLGTEVRDCKARWFTSGEYKDNFTGGIRTSGSVGTVTQSGNDFAAIISAE